MIKYIPNTLTILRIILAVPLFIFSLTGNKKIFVTLFLLGKITDVLDGYIARKFKCTSDLGSKLDSYADIIFDITSFVSFLTVEPLVYKNVEIYWFVGFGALIIAWLVGWIKTGKLTILHLYTNKAFGFFYTLYLFVSVIYLPIYQLLYISALLGIVASAEQIFIYIRYGKSVNVEITSFIDNTFIGKSIDK